MYILRDHPAYQLPMSPPRVCAVARRGYDALLQNGGIKPPSCPPTQCTTQEIGRHKKNLAMGQIPANLCNRFPFASTSPPASHSRSCACAQAIYPRSTTSILRCSQTRNTKVFFFFILLFFKLVCMIHERRRTSRQFDKIKTTVRRRYASTVDLPQLALFSRVDKKKERAAKVTELHLYILHFYLCFAEVSVLSPRHD